MENTAQNGQKRRGRPPAKAKEVLGAAPELPIDQPNVIDRGSMRPNMREDDPRVAAARRAAEIRANQVNDDGVDDEAGTSGLTTVLHEAELQWLGNVLVGNCDE